MTMLNPARPPDGVVLAWVMDLFPIETVIGLLGQTPQIVQDYVKWPDEGGDLRDINSH
jgi:hypothetical protein